MLPVFDSYLRDFELHCPQLPHFDQSRRANFTVIAAGLFFDSLNVTVVYVLRCKWKMYSKIFTIFFITVQLPKKTESNKW